VWIDVHTGLPVRRVGFDGDLVVVTETYTLTLDKKPDPRTFELPR